MIGLIGICVLSEFYALEYYPSVPSSSSFHSVLMCV